MARKDLESLFDRVRSWPEPLQEKAADVLPEIEALGSGYAVERGGELVLHVRHGAPPADF